MPEKVKIVLTVVDTRIPGICGEAVLKALEYAGFNVIELSAIQQVEPHEQRYVRTIRVKGDN